jgi:hypothetical protein
VFESKTAGWWLCSGSCDLSCNKCVKWTVVALARSNGVISDSLIA